MTRNKLRGARVEKNLTQTQLAELIGMSPATYCKKEQGQSDFYIREAFEICKVLGKSPEEIFFKQ
ncbi:MAG: helix-turn-helix domain-containing protein [Bacilli bacterium]